MPRFVVARIARSAAAVLLGLGPVVLGSMVLVVGLWSPAPHGVAADRAAATAALSVGASFDDRGALRPDVLNQVLGGLIGGRLALDAQSYEALRQARVSVVDLIAASVALKTLDQFLALEPTPRELLELLAETLAQRGDPAAGPLRALADAATAQGRARVGDWLVVAQGSRESALELVLSVLDLVRVSAIAGSGSRLVSFDSLADAAPGIARVGLRAFILAPPRIAVGPAGQDAQGAWLTEVRSPQIRVELALEATARVTGLGNSPLTLTVYQTSSEAIARLRGLECGSRASLTAVAAPGGARIGIGSFTDIESGERVTPANLAELRLLGAPVVRMSAANEVELQSPAETLVFQGPFQPRSGERAKLRQLAGTALPEVVSGAVAQLGNELVVRVARLGAVPVGFAQGRSASETEAILGSLLRQVPDLLTPVLQVFGIQAGGAELTILSVHSASGGPC
jgi:uncharacterized membrane protein